MDINELSAKYIYEDKDRLRMALHVYEAMPIVRKYLFETIFAAAGERLADKLTGIELECSEEGVRLWTEETGEFEVFVALERGRGDTIFPYAGVYEESGESIKERRNEIRERFETKVDLKAWSSSGIRSEDEQISAYVDRAYGGRWHGDEFLRRAVLSQDEVVSIVEVPLLRIYRGVFPLTSN